MKLGADITTTRRAIFVSAAVIWVLWIVIFGLEDIQTFFVVLGLSLVMVPLNYLQIVFALWLGRKIERIIWKNKENQHE